MTDERDKFKKMNEQERIIFFLDYIKAHPDWSENQMKDEQARKALPGEPVQSMLYYAARHNQPHYLYTILDNIPAQRISTTINDSSKVSLVQSFLENNHIDFLNKFLKQYCIVDEKIDTSFIKLFYKYLFQIHVAGKKYNKEISLQYVENIDKYLDKDFILFNKYCSHMYHNENYNLTELNEYLLNKKILETVQLDEKLSKKLDAQMNEHKTKV